MGIAALLLVVVIVDTVLTAFMVGRWRGVREEIKLMTDALTSLGAMLADAGKSDSVTPTSPFAGADADIVSSAKDVLASATPEDLAQARAVLESLGL